MTTREKRKAKPVRQYRDDITHRNKIIQYLQSIPFNQKSGTAIAIDLKMDFSYCYKLLNQMVKNNQLDKFKMGYKAIYCLK